MNRPSQTDRRRFLMSPLDTRHSTLPLVRGPFVRAVRARSCALFDVALAIGLLMAVLAASGQELEPLQRAFVHPPDSARPWVNWFWMDGNITPEGITADLEAMERVGIGGVLLMDISQDIPPGPVRFGSPQWRQMFQHTLAESQRLRLELNMNND